MKARVIFETHNRSAVFATDFYHEGTVEEIVAFANATKPGEYATIQVANNEECQMLRAAGWRGSLDTGLRAE